MDASAKVNCLAELEKANRILQKQLDRAKADQQRLEITNQQKESLLRRVIEEVKESQAVIEERSQALEQALKELQYTQAQLVQSEKMSSLGQLVAGVAHEINNPVNFIYANTAYAKQYVETLFDLLALYQSHYPNPVEPIQLALIEADLEFVTIDFPQILGSMRSGADRIKKIVLSLRNFARMDEADYKCVDIHDGINSALMILGSRLMVPPDGQEPIGGHRAAITVVTDYAPLPTVECYAGQLNQVFMELLMNAIDAIENHTTGVPGLIKITTALTDTQHIAIRISDTGSGIPATIQPHIFDPFFTTKPVGKGTGMGLAICYQIITQNHRGQLACNSMIGSGTEFVITIPLQPQGDGIRLDQRQRSTLD
jgi:two-component system, NtrC family, sensor kinase